jgi:hypothetical protein
LAALAAILNPGGPSQQLRESPKFWLTVLSELKSRGVADVCILCCIGLTGLPDAIGVVWPQATVRRWPKTARSRSVCGE